MVNMYEVKVKTLDGRTREFSVPENATVAQFKEIIKAEMDIEVERQRLLYQGRVLQDDLLLSSYEVAGNVMHLVTRMPPQARPATEVTTEREENSDINRDQIRHILSDVFSNIGDLNHPMGVSVNNEGNRMDITVNIPTQNRLSLSRLRQNYVHRLLHQARNVINHLEDPSTTVPRTDRERLRQADPYDIGANEERLTEVTPQPLPISNLADMIGVARTLWTSAEPQLEVWESVLRRESSPDSNGRSESEMQRIHDSASRYVHLFSHILHILSDYLVEFQNSGVGTRVVGTNANVNTRNDAATSVSTEETNNVPLTGAFGESGMAHSDANDTIDAPAEIGDRSRYLYVFSEMPAQLVQVRLDVDNIRDMRSPATTAQTTAAVPQPQTDVSSTINQSTQSTATEMDIEANVPQTTSPATIVSSTVAPATVAPATAAPATAAHAIVAPRPASTATAAPAPVATTASTATVDPNDPRARSRRRLITNHNVDNMFMNSIQDTLMGSNARPQMTSGGSRTIRSTPQFMDNVDPYVRCQSRHFQHPSNLRSGAVISTFSGIRLRETSRSRARPNEGTPTSTADTISAPMTNVRSTSTDSDPVRTLLSGLMSSIFTAPVAITATSPVVTATAAPTEQSTNQGFMQSNDIQRILQALTQSGGSNMNASLSQIFPDMFNTQQLDPDNFVTNQIIQIVISRLTLTDFMAIFHGQYSPLNQLRLPLQDILRNHQQEVGSRDVLIEHVVSDLEFFNKAYIAVFERLRSGTPVENLSEEARSSFNIRLDIIRTLNNLNRHHFQSMIDMIMRSPTNHGFGQLLMNSLTSHHEESLALIDIICNNNDELRKYLVKAFLDSLMSSMNPPMENGTLTPINNLGIDLLFGDINSGLFRRPEQLSELREHTLTNFAVYLPDNNEVDQSITNIDSIEDMVTNLSENIMHGTLVSDMDIVLPECTNTLVNEFMRDCRDIQQGETVLNGNASSWQNILPQEWIQIMSHDSNVPLESDVAYSDAYVSGLPPKRRKVIINQRQRAVHPSSEVMLQDCLDQAIASVGLSDVIQLRPLPTTLNDAFQDVVTERVNTRLTEEAFRFPSERFPSTERNFNRKKRNEDKKNN